MRHVYGVSMKDFDLSKTYGQFEYLRGFFWFSVYLFSFFWVGCGVWWMIVMRMFIPHIAPFAILLLILSIRGVVKGRFF